MYDLIRKKSKECGVDVKSYWGFILLLLVIITVVFFFTREMYKKETIYYDDDQEGLTEQIVIRFSHVVAENTPKGLAAQRFSNIIYEKSNGRVKVEVFPNGSLYNDNEEMAALLQNDVQMIAPTFSKLTDITSSWNLLDLPFFFDSKSSVERTFTGEIGEYLLSSLEGSGIKGLALWSNGFKQMTGSKKPLLLPEDFIGQRFRIMPSQVVEQQFQLLGATPVATPFNTLYYALENDEMDGQENTVSNIHSKRLYELQRYMTISNHGYLGYAVLMNEEYWSELPAEIQLLILEAMAETTAWILQESQSINEQKLQEIEEYSDIKIYKLTLEQREKWIETLHPIYEKFYREAEPELVELVKSIK
jgi:tripartite ATP-independent transporter DctP family solute receptor